MSLYLVTDGARQLWVAYEDDEHAQMYVWVPNTGKFHRNRGTEADYYWDQEHRYQPIEVPEARRLMQAGIGTMDERSKADLLARFRADSSALDPIDVLEDARR